ncbi:MAG: hypothetical protein ACRDL7_09755 [Gaiellaceae bacterium]
MTAATACMENKLSKVSSLPDLTIHDIKREVRSIFIDKELEDNVRKFTHKTTGEVLLRIDYLSYLKHQNVEMREDLKMIIRFMGTFCGHTFEVLKDDND